MGQPEMIHLQGREVRIAYDPADIADVTVWGMDGKFLCRAKANGVISGMTDENLRTGMAMKRHIKKTLRQADDVRHLAHKDVSELALLAAANAARANRADVPDANIGSLKPIKTDLDATLMHLVKPLKKAVGDNSSPNFLDRFLNDDSNPAEPGPPSGKNSLSDGLLRLAGGDDSDE